jgi:hypothetical protein
VALLDVPRWIHSQNPFELQLGLNQNAIGFPEVFAPHQYAFDSLQSLCVEIHALKMEKDMQKAARRVDEGESFAVVSSHGRETIALVAMVHGVESETVVLL